MVCKRGDALSPLVLNSASEYAIRKVHAVDVNILGGSVHTIKNTEALQ
jgi:Mrp family chromosome partitioning ATPase